MKDALILLPGRAAGVSDFTKGCGALRAAAMIDSLPWQQPDDGGVAA